MNQNVEITLIEYSGVKETYIIDLSKVRKIVLLYEEDEAIKVYYKDGSVEELSPGWDYTYGIRYEIYNHNDILLSDDFKSLLNRDRYFGDITCHDTEGLFLNDCDDRVPYSSLIRQRRYRKKDNHKNKVEHKQFIF